MPPSMTASQARLFGDAGYQILGRANFGIVGRGEQEYLGRLSVGRVRPRRTR
jgi:hypothetical protein